MMPMAEKILPYTGQNAAPFPRNKSLPFVIDWQWGKKTLYHYKPKERQRYRKAQKKYVYSVILIGYPVKESGTFHIEFQ